MVSPPTPNQWIMYISTPGRDNLDFTPELNSKAYKRNKGMEKKGRGLRQRDGPLYGIVKTTLKT